MTTSMARRERLDLCDLALQLGPEAPTACEGWQARDLVVHLLVREGSPLAAAGQVLEPLSRFAERARQRLRQEPYDDLVARLRSPGMGPYALPPVEKLVNTVEYFVHHEDLRRAQPDWSSRLLPADDESLLWSQLRVVGRGLVRSAGVPVEVVRAGHRDRATLRRGTGGVVLTGRPSELLLLLFGRPSVGVDVDGPPDAVARFEESSKGL